jgi:hypothetical protein
MGAQQWTNQPVNDASNIPQSLDLEFETEDENNQDSGPDNMPEISQEGQIEIPSKKEQQSIIRKLEAESSQRGLQAGDTWYIMSAKWWEAWKLYVEYESGTKFSSDPPGPIDNIALVTPNDHTVLRNNALESFDFILISEDIWKTLHRWQVYCFVSLN